MKIQNTLKQNNIKVILAILFVAIAIFWIGQAKPNGEEKSLTEFLYELRSQRLQIDKLVLYEKDNMFAYTSDGQQFIVPVPDGYFQSNNTLIESIAYGYFGDLQAFELEINRGFEWETVSFMLLVLTIVGYGVYKLIKKYSDSTNLPVNQTTAGVKQIFGYEAIKEPLQEIISVIQNPTNNKMDTSAVLLEGPIGNGKRTIVSAIAYEARVPLLDVTASQVRNESTRSKITKQIIQLWKKAKKPVVVLLEIDNKDISAIIQKLKSVNKKEMKAFILGVYDHDLSSQMYIEGFDQTFTICSPTQFERKEILQFYINLEKDRIEPVRAIWEEQYLDLLAKQTEGFSHKDLKKLIKVAHSLTEKKAGQPLTISHLREALSIVGKKGITNRTITQEEQRVMAYHQAGHAVAQMLLSPKGIKGVSHITLSPHGKSFGHISYVTDELKFISKNELLRKIQILFAGRVAEEILLDGDVTNLAKNDLKEANALIHQFVTKYGMSDSLQGCYVEDHYSHIYFIQDEINKLRELLYKQIKELLEENVGKIENIARHLLNYTFIEEYQLERILDGASY